MKAFYALSKYKTNISLEFDYLFTKYPMFKKEMICIWRGIYLYAATCSMTLRFTILSSFLCTRNPRIYKNYTLRILCLVVLYSSISIFNLTWHAFNIKPCLLYQHILMLFTFACFHFTIHLSYHNMQFQCINSIHNSIYEI